MGESDGFYLWVDKFGNEHQVCVTNNKPVYCESNDGRCCEDGKPAGNDGHFWDYLYKAFRENLGNWFRATVVSTGGSPLTGKRLDLPGDPECKNCGGEGYTVEGHDPSEQIQCDHCWEWWHKQVEREQIIEAALDQYLIHWRYGDGSASGVLPKVFSAPELKLVRLLEKEIGFERAIEPVRVAP